MQNLVLESREAKGKKLAPFRKEGKLPVVVYGHDIKESGNYFVDMKTFKKVYEAAGESSVVTLEFDGKTKDTLIHDVAVHPVTDEPLHADFLSIDTSKPVEVAVELNFVGVSPAVKNFGGLLIRVVHELEISVLPKHLVHSIDVDLTKLENLHDSITAADIKLPESASLKIDPTDVIVIVNEPKEEVEAAPENLEDAVKVEEKGKKEEGADAEGDKADGGAKDKESK